ncbi:MAG: ATPase, partial [Leptolyngbyaceae cyanobacterium RM2_2_21]|nr:ATPase [Leptolyngbyaceae cyanobacterium RM2_2_21]
MTVSRTICVGFLALIAIGTFLLLLPFSTSSGDWNSPLVALFTATSAVCVTGLIVVD